MNNIAINIGSPIDCKYSMKNTFSNESGILIFARDFFLLNDSIPSDRYIDAEYDELTRKTLLDDIRGLECKKY